MRKSQDVRGRLRVHRETLRQITDRELSEVRGGEIGNPKTNAWTGRAVLAACVYKDY